MSIFKKIIEFLLIPYRLRKQKIAYKKRIEELRRRDPFIYK